MGNQPLLSKSRYFDVYNNPSNVVNLSHLWDTGERMKRLKNWLIPHKGNSHTPIIFTVRGAFVTIFAVVLLGGGALMGKSFFSGGNASLAAVLPSVLVDLANQDRKEHSLKQLTVNPLLNKAAEKKAADMAAKSYFAHVSPEGVEPWFWLKAVGYKYRAAGENLAVHFDDSEAVNKAWMDSPSHRANIVNSEFTEIGIGTAVGVFEGRQTIFVAQFFGLPANPAVPVSKNNVKTSTSTSPTKVSTGSNSPTVEGVSTEQEISVVSGEFNDGALIATEDPSTQVINAVQPKNQKAPSSNRFSVPRRFVEDPLSMFSTVISLIAVMVTISLIMTAHHNVPRRRFSHIGSGLLVLLIVIGTYMFVQSISFNGGKTTDAAAVIFLSDGN